MTRVRLIVRFALTEAGVDATKAEQNRIKDILLLSRTGVEEFVRDLAFDEQYSNITKGDAAMLVYDKLQEIGTAALDTRRGHTIAVLPESDSQLRGTGELSGEELWKQQYTDDFDGVRNGKDGFSSVENYIAFMEANEKGLVKHSNPAYAARKH